MINEFTLFARPWPVNLFILAPFATYYVWRREGLTLTRAALVATCFFGMAFGFVEAAVVVYLRAAVGLLPGYGGSLADVAGLSANIFQQAQILDELPQSLRAVELIREAATMIMLVSVALLTVKTTRERCAIFLWTFAIWDISYYLGSWTTVRWPPSLFTADVLFLIPVPWFAQVWFPILVSALFMGAVLVARRVSLIGSAAAD